METKMAGILGAIASNAGDYFHYIYVVRQMLEMLHPRSLLKRIEIEGISQDDLPSINDTYIVDVSEYFAGDNFRSAEKVIISQLKYSYANATQNWTLADICRNDKDSSGNEKPRTSLIGELAQLFDQYLGQYGESVAEKLQLQIFTNRPIQPSLKQRIEIVLQTLENKSPDQIPSALGKLSRNNQEIDLLLNQLQVATSFSNQWKNLGLFLKAINWEAFNQPDINQQKRQAFETALEFGEDSSEDWYRRLLVFVIETAMSKQVSGITERDVCRTLGINQKYHFFPAQNHVESADLEKYQLTQAYSSLQTKIDEMLSGFLLLHGGGGTGKSTLIQHFAQTYASGQNVAVYAAWAGQPGDERYPLKIFLTQMINELDSLYETNILAITKDNIQSLKRRFREALTSAARAAENRGHKLVLMVDAVDEAVIQYQEHSEKRFQVEDLFVDLLFEIQLPENCVCVVSTRTENIELLNPPDGLERIEIKGFDQLQTANYARLFVPELSDAIVELLFIHSEGIPRVIDFTLETGQKEHVSDWMSHIPKVAKVPLEKAYADGMKSVERDIPDIRRFLAIFQELQGPVSVALLAAVIQQTVETIKYILAEKIYFGLSLNQTEQIVFSNKNFEDFAREYVQPLADDAKQHIATYCTNTFPDNYAINHIIFHLYRANRFVAVITHLLNYFEDHVAHLSPFQEDFLRDLQYGLIAAVNTDQYAGGVQLLVHSATLAHGGDVFAKILEDFVDIATEYGYQHRLMDHVKKTVFEEDQAKYLLSIGAELAHKSKEPNLAADLVWQSQQSIQRKSSYHHPDSEGIYWDNSEILPFVLYICFTADLKSGLEKLLNWHPEEHLYSLFTEVIKRYAEVSHDINIVEVIESTSLSEIQKCYSFYGWIAVGNYRSLNTLNKVLKRVILHINEMFDSSRSNSKHVGDVILNLIANHVSARDIQQFLPFWRPRQLYEHDFRHVGLDKVDDFLRWCAVKEILGLEMFDPDQYEFADTPNDDNYHKDERIKAARKILATHYRIILAHIKTLRNGGSWDDLSFTRDVIEHWKDDYYRYSWTLKPRFIDYVCVTFKAIVACPEPYFQIVQDIVARAESYLSKGSVSARPRFIKVLAQRQEYYAICEDLVKRQLDDISVGRIASSERVESILQMCSALRLMHMNEQAYDVFLFARDAANQWDRFGFGRSLALIATAEAVQKNGQSLTRNQSIDLLDVFDYVNDILNDERGSLFDAALTIVGRNHPDIALAGLRHAESQDHIHFGTGLTAIAKGMQDEAEVHWPLIHIMEPLDVEFLLELATRHRESIDLPDFLERLAWRIRIITNIDVQAQHIRDIIQWAGLNGLSDDTTIQKMQHYLYTIQEFPKNSNSSYTLNQSGSSSLTFNSDPLIAFREITTILSTNDISITLLVEKIRDMLPQLTNDQKIELVELVISRENSGTSTNSDTFVLLVDIAESIGTKSYYRTSLNRVKQSLIKFSNKHVQSLLIYYYHDVEREKSLRLAHSPVIDNSTFFKAILHPIAVELTQLTADRMYMAIAFLANRLGEEAQIVFQMLLERSLDAINHSSENLSGVVKEGQDLLDFLFDYLGDPQVELCWRVVHCLAEMSIHAPSILLPRIFERSWDTEHARWMSIRDWLLFIVHHIALRRADLLAPYVNDLVDHALNPEFPHAKIREHAKQVVLAIEAQSSGSVKDEVLERVKAINQPISSLTEPSVKSKHKTNQLYDSDVDIVWEDIATNVKRENNQDENYPFNFYSIGEEWFGDLARRFDKSVKDVEEAAMKWIVSWKFTDEICNINRDLLRQRFGDNTKLFRYKSDLPSVISLRTYIEYHCIHLIAGEWIDSKPVNVDDEHRSYRSWRDWVINNIYDIDPVLISRLVDSPPLNPLNFGIRPVDFQQWSALDKVEEFFEILEPPQDDPNWLVISESSDAHFSDYQHGVHVDAVTVTQETAFALARAISAESSEGYIGLPEYELEHETKLHMIEEVLSRQDLGIDIIDLSRGDTIKLVNKHPRFEMHPLAVHWTVSEDMGQFDPYWQERARSLRILSPQFINSMNLERVPLSLNYRDSQGIVVGKFETWHSEHYRNQLGSRERYSSGSRFLVSKNVLITYLQKNKHALVLKVNVTRNRPYSYDRGKGKERDIWVRTYGFVYDENGKLTLC